MSHIDWDGGGIEYYDFSLGGAHFAGEAVDLVPFSDMEPGMHVQYEASRGRSVDICVLGKVAAFPYVTATQHVPRGYRRVIRGQLRGCDDGSGGDAIAGALAMEHSPLIYSRRTPHDMRLPFAHGQLYIQDAHSELS